MIDIQIAKPADAATLAYLGKQTFIDTYSEFNTQENMDKFVSENFTTDKLLLEINDGNNTFLIAFMENEAVGYVKMRDLVQPAGHKIEGSIEIQRIYADKKHIRKGIGKSLMKNCIEIAKAKGKKVIWLGVWENNEPAIRFYHKFGFEQFGTHVFMLGNDPQTDFLLWKKL